MASYRRGLSGLADQHIQQAIVRGANAAAAKTRTRTKRVVAKAMGLRQNVIDDDIKVIKAKSTGRMPARGANILVVAKGRRVRLVYWSKGEKLSKRKGIIKSSEGMRANAWGQMKTYPGTFLAPIRYKTRGGESKSTLGIFKRLTKKSLPIQQLYGPGVGREAERHEDEIMDFFSNESEVQIRKKLDAAIRRELSKQ